MIESGVRGNLHIQDICYGLTEVGESGFDPELKIKLLDIIGGGLKGLAGNINAVSSSITTPLVMLVSELLIRTARGAKTAFEKGLMDLTAEEGNAYVIQSKVIGNLRQFSDVEMSHLQGEFPILKVVMMHLGQVFNPSAGNWIDADRNFPGNNQRRTSGWREAAMRRRKPGDSFGLGGVTYIRTEGYNTDHPIGMTIS